jgi:hypothetical protein
MRFRVTRTARRHKIGNAHMLAAIAAAGEPTVEETDRVRLLWVGVDDRGIELEIIGLVADEDPDLVIIIHCMPTTYPRKETR